MRTDESLVRTYERKPAQHHCQEQLHYMLDAQQPQLQVTSCNRDYNNFIIVELLMLLPAWQTLRLIFN